MSDSEARAVETERIEALETEIRAANKAYWIDNQPLISDGAYDKLIEDLKQLNPQSTLLTQIGAGQVSEIGSDSDDILIPSQDSKKERDHHHRVAMLSLDKCYDDQTLTTWFEKFEGPAIAMPKFDGIAASLLYSTKTGKFVVGATRGDGRVGEQVTQNLAMIESIPKQIDRNVLHEVLPNDAALSDVSRLEIRGEVYMTLDVFKRFSQDFANPRNLTAGAVRLKDSAKSKSYALSFIAYDLLCHEVKQADRPTTEVMKFDRLDQLGFDTPTYVLVDAENMHRAFVSFSSRASELNFEVDGFVYKANDVSEQLRLGATAHHPRFAIAYKIQGDTKQTRVDDIIWQISRNGTLTPVAVVAPVTLSGAEITRVTLHHAGMIAELDISIGDRVAVTRRGGVIPKIEAVTDRAGRHVSGSTTHQEGGLLPVQCPACSAKTQLTGDVLTCCKGSQCPAAIAQYLIFFAKASGMQGFGPRIVEACVNAGFLNTPADYFSLTVDGLATLDRLGKKSAQNLVAEVASIRNIELHVFLYALGLPDVGKQTAQLLAQHFGDLSSLRAATVPELASLPGIADVVAGKIVHGLEESAPLIDDLVAVMKIESPAANTGTASERHANHLFSGKSVVFTGKLLGISRADAQSLVKEMGGSAPSQISTRTDYLVVGEGGGGGSKLKKAEKLSVSILSESDFLAAFSDRFV